MGAGKIPPACDGVRKPLTVSRSFLVLLLNRQRSRSEGTPSGRQPVSGEYVSQHRA